MNHDAAHARDADKGTVVMVVMMVVMMMVIAPPRNDNHVMMVVVVAVNNVLRELNTSGAFRRQPRIVGDQQFGCI
jgi:hypothetical protein